MMRPKVFALADAILAWKTTCHAQSDSRRRSRPPIGRGGGSRSVPTGSPVEKWTWQAGPSDKSFGGARLSCPV